MRREPNGASWRLVSGCAAVDSLPDLVLELGGFPFKLAPRQYIIMVRAGSGRRPWVPRRRVRAQLLSNMQVRLRFFLLCTAVHGPTQVTICRTPQRQRHAQDSERDQDACAL